MLFQYLAAPWLGITDLEHCDMKQRKFIETLLFSKRQQITDFSTRNETGSFKMLQKENALSQIFSLLLKQLERV